MKKLITAILLSMTLIFGGVAIASEQTAKQDTQLLFIQMAPSASLTKVVGKKGVYKLTLHNINGKVEYFSDRPVRTTGTTDVETFLAGWDKEFTKSPPNVGVVGIEKSPESTQVANLVLELYDPHYDADKHEMTYLASVVPGNKKVYGNMEFEGVALFIDDFCASCVSSGF